MRFVPEGLSKLLGMHKNEQTVSPGSPDMNASLGAEPKADTPAASSETPPAILQPLDPTQAVTRPIDAVASQTSPSSEPGPTSDTPNPAEKPAA